MAKKTEVKSEPKQKKEIEKKPSVKLVSFKIGAVIPTQSYGNIQPEVVVTADTFEEARDTAVPWILDLYKEYMQNPFNGTSSFFLEPKDLKVDEVVSETERHVAPEVIKKTSDKPLEEGIGTGAFPVYEAFVKAKNAVEAAESREALDAIELKIKSSVKVEESDKPILFAIILKKKKELK